MGQQEYKVSLLDLCPTSCRGLAMDVPELECLSESDERNPGDKTEEGWWRSKATLKLRRTDRPFNINRAHVRVTFPGEGSPPPCCTLEGDVSILRAWQRTGRQRGAGLACYLDGGAVKAEWERYVNQQRALPE